MINVLLRQPFTETNGIERQTIQNVMNVIHDMKTDFDLHFLSPCVAQDAQSFQQYFEQTTKQRFNPVNFRRHRLALLDKADAFLVIRTSMSESSAFEVAYNVYAGQNAPLFFAIEKKAAFKTTLLKELDNATYVHFDQAEELIQPLRDFFTRITSCHTPVLNENHHDA